MFTGLVRRGNTNNFLGSAGQVSFLTPGFSIYGDALVLGKGIVSHAGPNQWNIPLTLASAQSLMSSNDTLTVGASVNNNGHNLLIAGAGDTVLAGVLSGSGGLTKAGAGRLTLARPASYAGDTVINEGVLALAASGSLAASSNLIVGAGANRDAVNGLAVGTSQTLKGSGTITGNTVILGKLEPGLPLGRLNFAGDLALSGVTLLELSRSPLTNDHVSATGTITFGGTLSLTNLSGTPLAPGDSFKLFNAAPYSGSFAEISPSRPGPGLAWETSALASSGTLSVIATVNPNPTHLSVHISGDQLTFSWPPDHTGWTLQSQTNGLGVGVSDNWVDLPGSTTTNQVVVPINPAAPAVFHRLRL